MTTWHAPPWDTGSRWSFATACSVTTATGSSCSSTLQSCALVARSSTLPPSPLPPLKKWGDPSSKFSKAPEMAAQKARLAQLQKENDRLSQQPQHTDSDQNTNNSQKVNNSLLLPPIRDSGTHKSNPATLDEEDSVRAKEHTPLTKSTQKPPAPKSGSHQTKSTTPIKGRKFPKKGARKVDKPLPTLKLPTIHSASGKGRNVWDSGHHHLLVHVPSTHLEKNQVGEECRNFRQTSVVMPSAVDAKRTEIRRPVRIQPVGSRVQFRRRPNPDPAPDSNTKHAAYAVHSTPAADPNLTPTVDHFPKNTPRLPELDDGSSMGEESDDGTEEPSAKTQQAQRTSFPAIDMPKGTKLPHPQSLAVPPLRLPRGVTPSAASINTVQSGATHMSMLSQEVREWKGAYMRSEDPHRKGRMLMDILHATRQRMQDNEEDLRLSGDLDGLSVEGRSDVMLLHRDSTTLDSGANTARSSLEHQQSKPFKLPHYTKKRAAAGGGGGQGSRNTRKLHRYLHKLTNQRKAGDQPHHQPPGTGAPFPLATMTIREITQTSLEHHSSSTVQTAS
ncbi:hypothetical protein ACOMHN_059884 [Nucella lapillus]